MRLGHACAFQARAFSRSGVPQSPACPRCHRRAVSSRRQYIAADSISSSAQVFSRFHPRIKLSCEMSITVSASRVSPSGGITKEALGWRNTSITSVTSASVASARAHRVPRVVGRRTPRVSVALSVSALNSFSQICCCRMVLSSA